MEISRNVRKSLLGLPRDVTVVTSHKRPSSDFCTFLLIFINIFKRYLFLGAIFLLSNFLIMPQANGKSLLLDKKMANVVFKCKMIIHDLFKGKE